MLTSKKLPLATHNAGNNLGSHVSEYGTYYPKSGWAEQNPDDELGLAEGTIVGQGPLDAVAAMSGVNVVEPGGMALIGGSSTPLFGLSPTEIHADVCGLPIYTTKETQAAACLGNAIVAAVAAGEYASIPEAAAKMVKMDEVFEPNMENHKRYQFFVEKYIETWPQIRHLVHHTVRYIS